MNPHSTVSIKYTHRSHRPTKLFLTPALTTPPTPKAGMILHIRAKLLISQSFLTFVKRALQPIIALRLYKSSPSRCSGVDASCIAAGARNCAALARLTFFSTPSLSGRRGAIIGGRLNEAKIVMESRSANSAYVAGGITLLTDVFGPNIFANCESLIRPSDMLMLDVATNFGTPAVVVSAG